jgi:hypothetical protein
MLYADSTLLHAAAGEAGVGLSQETKAAYVKTVREPMCFFRPRMSSNVFCVR